MATLANKLIVTSSMRQTTATNTISTSISQSTSGSNALTNGSANSTDAASLGEFHSIKAISTPRV
ncbi:hypothetical protein HDU98_001591 [Podochytrium sp. JEL0797]|nr:hypothetical protein HDU98_001591 [Podochytrium sp. JEL0797]